MSLKTVFTALLAAALSMAAVSCIENNRAMGEGLLPEGYIPVVGTHTFDVPVTNRVSDSVQSFNSSNMLVGTMSDPVFGTVIANAASYIVPYSDSTDFGEDAELIGAYLTLSVDSTYFMESNQEGIHQRIRIYRLNRRIDSTMQFCNSLTPDMYDPEPVTVSDPVIYGKGSIRIDLKDDYARELLATTKEEFEDMDLFLDRIHGLYIEIEKPLGNPSGGRLNYLNLGYSTINLDYHTKVERANGETVGVDTTESFVFGYVTAVNNFTTGSASLESDNPGEFLYLEGLSGVKPHISAASLKSMIDDWLMESGLQDKNVILARAELKFPYEMPQDFERFDKEHPQSIYAFTNTPWATDTLRQFSPLEEVYRTDNIGSINRSERFYSMDITVYLQQLMSTDAAEVDRSMDLWIAPMSESSNSYYDSSVYYSIDNHNYNKIILNGPAAERRPTLTVTYGILEK